MLRSIKELHGYSIHATDGEIGDVSGCYFDDKTWLIRYFVIETGNWLRGREVLLAPGVLGIPNWEERNIPVLLTKKQVEDSPLIDTHLPVSRQMEEQLSTHYGWTPYWAMIPSPFEWNADAVTNLFNKKESETEQGPPSNPNLRSTREVMFYNVHAIDGSLGYIDDFIVDDQMWPIRYLVVAYEERKVLISPHWAEDINWSRKIVKLGLEKNSIKVAPEFDPEEPINREYEVRLYDYYGRPKYWVRI